MDPNPDHVIPGTVAGTRNALESAAREPSSTDYYVDVQDDAFLHVAAAILPEVQSERIFAFAETTNGDRILDVFRRLYPTRSLARSREVGVTYRLYIVR
ncbi:hypothetical protein VTK26DRAFT_7574 [Humicola hyalothermophila]